MNDVEKRSAIFVDTSIQILRIIGSKKHKARIENRLKQYDLVVTSLVVRQEFKRRLLKEMQYLIQQLDRRHSLPDLLTHLNQGLGPFHRRKAAISIGIVTSFMERRVVFPKSSDEEVDSFKAFLEMLLEGGLDDFDDMVDHVISQSQCAAGNIAIRRKGKRYDFGHDKCSQHSSCNIQEMLTARLSAVTAIIEAIPDPAPTTELGNGKQFLEKAIKDASGVRGSEPCLKVGDTIIAIESDGIPSFYTKNYRESQYLSPALKQTLIVRPNREDDEDIICPFGEKITAFDEK